MSQFSDSVLVIGSRQLGKPFAVLSHYCLRSHAILVVQCLVKVSAICDMQKGVWKAMYSKLQKIYFNYCVVRLRIARL
jgi:hypothetical protein